MPVDVLLSVRIGPGRSRRRHGAFVSAKRGDVVDSIIAAGGNPLGTKGQKTLGWIRCPDVPDDVVEVYGSGLNSVQCRLCFRSADQDRRFAVNPARLRLATTRAPGLVDRALDRAQATPLDDIPSLPWLELIKVVDDTQTGKKATVEDVAAHVEPVEAVDL